MFQRDTLKLTDNTLLKEQDIENNGPVLLQPYISDKGNDCVIETIRQYPKFINDHGEPNFYRHGQAIYQAVNWLRGGGIVKGCRLTAKDATRANIALCVEVELIEKQKTNEKDEKIFVDSNGKETIIATGNKPVMVKNAQVGLTTRTFANISDGETAKAQLRALYTTPEDLIKKDVHGKPLPNQNGLQQKYVFPLYLFVCRGKGKYGNDFRIRFSQDMKEDKDNRYRNYRFQLLLNEKGLSSCPYTLLKFTNDPDSRGYDKRTLYLPEVINSNKMPIIAYGIEEMYTKCVDLLYSIINQDNKDEIIERRDIDLLTFRNARLDVYNNIEISDKHLDVTKLEGFELKSGNDGAFDMSNPNRDDAINERYSEFYKGKIDDSIFNSQEHSIDMALDACMPLDVKRSIIKFSKLRPHTTTIIDSGYIYTEESLIGFVKDDIRTESRDVKIYAQAFTTYDEFTGKHIRFTTTYLLSLLYPAIIKNSPEVPLAGIDYPLDMYMDEDSLVPIIKDVNKDDIYDCGINFIHKEKQKYVFASDINTLGKESELLYGNNVLVLNQMIRDVQGLSSIFRFHFSGEASDYKTLNKIADDHIDKYRGKMAKLVEINISSNDQDPSHKRIRTKLRVGFRRINLANDIDIYVDRM